MQTLATHNSTILSPAGPGGGAEAGADKDNAATAGKRRKYVKLTQSADADGALAGAVEAFLVPTAAHSRNATARAMPTRAR